MFQLIAFALLLGFLFKHSVHDNSSKGASVSRDSPQTEDGFGDRLFGLRAVDRMGWQVIHKLKLFSFFKGTLAGPALKPSRFALTEQVQTVRKLQESEWRKADSNYLLEGMSLSCFRYTISPKVQACLGLCFLQFSNFAFLSSVLQLHTIVLSSQRKWCVE